MRTSLISPKTTHGWHEESVVLEEIPTSTRAFQIEFGELGGFLPIEGNTQFSFALLGQNQLDKHPCGDGFWGLFYSQDTKSQGEKCLLNDLNKALEHRGDAQLDGQFVWFLYLCVLVASHSLSSSHPWSCEITSQCPSRWLNWAQAQRFGCAIWSFATWKEQVNMTLIDILYVRILFLRGWPL